MAKTPEQKAAEKAEKAAEEARRSALTQEERDAEDAAKAAVEKEAADQNAADEAAAKSAASITVTFRDHNGSPESRTFSKEDHGKRAGLTARRYGKTNQIGQEKLCS